MAMNWYGHLHTVVVGWSRSVTQTEHVAGMGDQEMHVKCWLENFEGNDHLGDFYRNVSVLLKLFLNRL